MPKFSIRQVFQQIAGHDKRIAVGGMYLRPYVPLKDTVVSNYSTTDWTLIFKGMTEEELAEYSRCSNVVVLIWCDANTDEAVGMLYWEEVYDHLGTLTFHGGTWNHVSTYFYEIYRSLIFLIKQLLQHGFNICTTCGLNNAKADRFQGAMGFVETGRDEWVAFKELDVRRFNESPIVKRMLKIN